MAWGKKEKPVVVFKEDKAQAKRMRDAAKTKLQQAGIEGKETKKGVGRDVAKTAKGREEQAKREKINKLAARSDNEDPRYTGYGHSSVTKRGSTGNRLD